jgi:hypothetical protein
MGFKHLIDSNDVDHYVNVDHIVEIVTTQHDPDDIYSSESEPYGAIFKLSNGVTFKVSVSTLARLQALVNEFELSHETAISS